MFQALPVRVPKIMTLDNEWTNEWMNDIKIPQYVDDTVIILEAFIFRTKQTFKYTRTVKTVDSDLRIYCHFYWSGRAQ